MLKPIVNILDACIVLKVLTSYHLVAMMYPLPLNGRIGRRTCGMIVLSELATFSTHVLSQFSVASYICL
jgi:hypothetical protein